jgi:hypothetical protein
MKNNNRFQFEDAFYYFAIILGVTAILARIVILLTS